VFLNWFSAQGFFPFYLRDEHVSQSLVQITGHPLFYLIFQGEFGVCDSGESGEAIVKKVETRSFEVE
jgi:hypothetical protein